MSEGAGKGDAYRPVNQKVYAENYDRIFRKPIQTWWGCPKCGTPMNRTNPCPCGESNDKAARSRIRHDESRDRVDAETPHIH